MKMMQLTLGAAAALALCSGNALAAAPDWERLAPVPLQTVCLRHLLPSAGEGELASHNLSIAARINGSGRAYVTPSILKGKQMIRVSIGAERTERRHVEALWEQMRAAARV